MSRWVKVVAQEKDHQSRQRVEAKSSNSTAEREEWRREGVFQKEKRRRRKRVERSLLCCWPTLLRAVLHLLKERDSKVCEVDGR